MFPQPSGTFQQLAGICSQIPNQKLELHCAFSPVLNWLLRALGFLVAQGFQWAHRWIPPQFPVMMNSWCCSFCPFVWGQLLKQMWLWFPVISDCFPRALGYSVPLGHKFSFPSPAQELTFVSTSGTIRLDSGWSWGEPQPPCNCCWQPQPHGSHSCVVTAAVWLCAGIFQRALARSQPTAQITG